MLSKGQVPAAVMSGKPTDSGFFFLLSVDVLGEGVYLCGCVWMRMHAWRCHASPSLLEA